MSVELCVLCVWTWTPSGSHCIVLVSGHNGKSRGQAGLSSTLKRVAFAFSSRANSIYIYTATRICSLVSGTLIYNGHGMNADFMSPSLSEMNHFMESNQFANTHKHTSHMPRCTHVTETFPILLYIYNDIKMMNNWWFMWNIHSVQIDCDADNDHVVRHFDTWIDM